MKGYVGKVLFVNLTDSTTRVEKVSDNVYENYLSGCGLGAYMCYKYIPADADPLGPDNMLGFTSGLLSGTPMFMVGRWMAVCKSPLTGGWGDANCGGTLSPAIKQCGYDAIFVTGCADKPVYLYIDNKGPQILPADDVWGKDAVEVENMLEKRHWVKKKPAVAVIGQAGENLSLVAGISNDRGRMAARSGVGAVMGSKKLKAVVLAGSKPIRCVDIESVKEISKRFGTKVKKVNFPRFVSSHMMPLMGSAIAKMPRNMAADGITSVGILKKFGTGYGNDFGIPSGDDPVKNWGGSVKDFGRKHYRKVSANVVQKREIHKYHCYGCAIGCGGICQMKESGRGEYEETHKPEYETVNAFGALLLNDDLDSIYYINELLNRAGMDTISAGNIVAYAIECHENGLISTEQLDGLDMRWGNSEAVIELLKKMITRDGVGDKLADGVKCAIPYFGEETAKYAMHAGGQEPGMHDARFDPLLGLHFSADPTPGRHTIGMGPAYNFMQPWKYVSWAPNSNGTKKADDLLDTDENALKSVASVGLKQFLDAIGGCFFALATGLYNWEADKALNAATGWNRTAEEYVEAGLRIQTLRQQFNIKHGINPIDYKMVDRLAGVPPLREGPLKGVTLPIEAMMRSHWEHMGWSRETGAPLTETLSKYGISSIEEIGGDAI